MFFYFLLIRIAALCGHKKAQALLKGQSETIKQRTKELNALRGSIWFHAASVGEFEQARPMIERLKREHPEKKIVVTFFSPSGYEMRKNYNLADGVFYLPLATGRNAKRFIEALRPSMAIFVKYEFWPAYLKELKKRDIPTYCISAIFRPKQRFFRWYGWPSRKLLKCFTHIYVQDERSEKLLKDHGISSCSVAGDTRFDRVAHNSQFTIHNSLPTRGTIISQFTKELGLIERFVEGCERVVVAGSTWPEDEKLLEAYMKRTEYSVQSTDQVTKLILVPHEIDEAHLHFIFNLFKGCCVRYTRATETALLHANVLIIDTMGLLSTIYRYGHAAYVGGGFGEGIHNTIEPAAFGRPVVFGPNYHHFREAQGLIDAGAGKSVKDYRELAAALDEALDNHQEMGDKAYQYVASEIGATDRIYGELFNH